jgi:LPPG:FO 2-phospho-L-lactate transferase
MVTVCSGGTGTPKLLAGLTDVFDPADMTVVGNTGDDAFVGGALVSPDCDTVLYERAGRLDRETWWGQAGDTFETDDAAVELAEALDDALSATEPPPDTAARPGGYLPPERQTAGPRLARWRRFDGVGGPLSIGDRDRAVHLVRTALLDAGHSLTSATRALARAYDLTVDLVPMSDDPVATLIHTPEMDRPLHFQEYWVGHRGDVEIDGVEFRGSATAAPGAAVPDALGEPVVIGPANPVTSIGPLTAIDGIRRALQDTPVVAVSPFVGREAFSGPAADLLAATGHEPSTAGVADCLPFVDGFVIDDDEPATLDRPTVRTDLRIDAAADASRIARACRDCLAGVGATEVAA